MKSYNLSENGRRLKRSKATWITSIGCAPSLFWFFLSIGLFAITHLQAQTLTTLHSFTRTGDGANPQSALVLSNNILYGCTQLAGQGGSGTVFSLNTDGTAFQTLYGFAGDTDGNSAAPAGQLALVNGALYVTASGLVSGSVFKINTDGSGPKRLYTFGGGNDGGNPFGGVVLSGKTLYGTTSWPATVFKVDIDGTGFVTLRCLSCGLETNSDKLDIYSGLVVAGDSLYGTTRLGGTYNAGTIFKLGTNGSGFKTLHHFNGGDGSQPVATLVLSGNTLYGTTWQSTNGGGTVFAINIDGTGFKVLHNFSGTDGAWPIAGLISSGNTLYGTTYGVSMVKDGSPSSLLK